MHQHPLSPAPDAPAVASDAAPAQPFLTADKIVLLLGLITYGIGQSVLFIVFPSLVNEIGLSLTQYGVIMSVSNLALALAAVYWGRRSDRVGRKPMILLGLAGYALGTTGVAIALEWGVRGSPSAWALFGAILLARLVYGGLAAAINPAASAYIADTTSRDQRARGMALLGMTSGLGTILGPVMGGSLAFISVIFPLYAAVALSLVAIIGIAVLLREPRRHAAPAQARRWLSPRDPRIRSLLVVLLFFWTFFTMIQVIIAFYLQEQMGIEGSASVAGATSTALIAMAMAALFMQLVVIQRWRITPRMMLRLGLPAFLLGMLALYLASTLYLVWLAFGLFGISMALTNPGIMGGASLLVEPHEQGALGGLLSAVPVLGMAAGPLLGSVLFAAVSPTFPILVAGMALCLLTVFAWRIPVPER